VTAAPATRPVSILPILTVNFIGTLGYAIVLPFLVFVVVRLGGNAVVYGVIGATYSFFQLIGAPLLGRWSDRIGRKRVLVVSQLGTFVSWGIFLVALALPTTVMTSVDAPALGRFTLTVPLLVLFIARALDGITGGNVSVANAYLADITSDAERSTNFGRLAISSNLGYVVGPALAGLLGATAVGERLPVIAAFLVSGVATGIIVTTLHETRPCVLTGKLGTTTVRDILGGDHKECYRIRHANVSGSQVLRLPHVGLLLVLQCLVFLAFNFYYVAFPMYASTALRWTLGEVGVYFAVMSVMMALIQGPVLQRLSKRFGDRWLVVGGSLVLGAGFALFSSSSTAVIYLGTFCVALGNGLMWPSLLAVLSKATTRDVQGAVQGFAGSVNAVASIAGLLVGGALYQYLGARVFLLSALVTGFVAALGIGVPSTPATGK
jgi:DHA1 family tetracycline resistance protein-like MFS transporter